MNFKPLKKLIRSGTHLVSSRKTCNVAAHHMYNTSFWICSRSSVVRSLSAHLLKLVLVDLLYVVVGEYEDLDLRAKRGRHRRVASAVAPGNLCQQQTRRY